MITLYHCMSARSFRPLWALEEMGLDYELKMLPFPPRVFAKEYKEINPLGTIPFFVDGKTQMTESCAIAHYVVTKYGPSPLAVDVSEDDYGLYLNGLLYGEATITFPQTIVLRYTIQEPQRDRGDVADDYGKWFGARLRYLDAIVSKNEYFCAGRFTAADICVSYALMLAENLKLDHHFSEPVRAYWQRLQQRPAFQRALASQQKAAEEQGLARTGT